MPAPLTIESIEKQNSILLLYGNNNPLITYFLQQNSKPDKIILVSPDNIAALKTEDIIQIDPQSAYLVTKLEEQINYALLFFTGEKDKPALASLLEKLKKDRVKTVLIIPVDLLPQAADILSVAKEAKSTIVILGDMFNAPSFIDNNALSNIMQQALAQKTVYLTGNDLYPLFPISFADAITGLKYLLYSSHTKASSFYFFYQHPQTIISAVHLIKRVEPELEVKLEEKKEQRTPRITREEATTHLALSNLKPTYLDHLFKGFEKSIQEIGPTVQSIITPEKKQEKRVLPNAIQSIPRFPFLKIGVVAFLLFFILNMTFFIGGILSAQRAQTALQKQNTTQAITALNQAQILLRLSLPFIYQVSSLPFPHTIHTAIEGKTYVLSLAEDILNNTTELVQATEQYTLKNPPALEALLSHLSQITYIYFKTVELSNSGQDVPDLLSQNASLFAFSSVAPDILGYTSEKNYLLLFQNNGELRPTGGFIGSIGELTLNKGKIEQLSIKDVYDVDGQLKTHVEPSYVIRRYLQPHLYLRDSNFSLDFQNAASTSALLYKLSTGKEVDGVIAIDYEVLKEIIASIGPLNLADYQKTLTKDNAFDFIHNTIESTFFPGSTQKKDLLTAVMNQIIIKLETDKNAASKLVTLLPKLMEEKHLLFAFRDESVQSLFTTLGYAGTFSDTRMKEKGVVQDIFAINEANIGVNKANTHIKRSVTYNASIQKEALVSDATISLANTGQQENYQVYLRIITPENSQLQSVTIDGVAQKITPAITDPAEYESPRFKKPVELELDTTHATTYTAYGFITTVAKNTIQKIRVTYASPLTDSSFSQYSLLVIKQPGITSMPFTLQLHYPPELKVENSTHTILGSSQVSQQQEIVKDTLFKFSFSKREN